MERLFRSQAGPVALAVLVLIGAAGALGAQAIESPEALLHRVSAGESLEEIARQHDLSVARLVELNAWLAEADAPSPGVELRVSEAAPLSEWPGVGVEVLPDRGTPGEALTLRVAGLEPGQEVLVGAGLKNSEALGFVRLKADSQGRATREFRIPMDSVAGEQWVVLVSTPDWSVKALSNPVLVLEPGELIG